MTFTVADLLDQLSIDAAIEPPKLAKSLKLTKQSEKECLDLALDALGRIGIIAIQDDGGVLRCEDDQLIDARLRCSSKGFCFAIRHDGGDDIYIRDHQLNHAWNGDRVLVRITREGGDVDHRKEVSSASSNAPPRCWPRWNARMSNW